MKYLKYLLLVAITISCSKDDSIEKPLLVEDEFIPIGEISYTPVEGPVYNGQLNLEVMNDSIFTIGVCLPDFNIEGIFMAKYSDSLQLDDSTFPINGMYQLETRRVYSHTFNNQLYVSHVHTNGNSSAISKFMKVNTDGALIWETEIPFNFFARQSVNRNNDIIVYGNRNWNFFDNFNHPISLLVFDTSGNIINQIDLSDLYTSGNDIKLLDDNTFVLTCLKRDEGLYDIKPHLINVDFNGNILWELQLDYFDDFVFRYDLFHLEKGTDAIYFSYTSRVGAPLKLGKVSYNGALVWKKTVERIWSNDTFEFIEDMILDQNNNIYLIGENNNSTTTDARYMSLAKYSTDGDLLNAYIHTTPYLWGQSIKVLNNELITASRDYGNAQVSLMKFNFDLEVR